MSELERDSLQEDKHRVSWEAETLEALSLEAPTLVQHTAHDVLLAHAALLDNVFVVQQTDQEAFRLVKAHIKELEQWHERHTGWRVQRGSAFFRLERHLHMILPVFID